MAAAESCRHPKSLRHWLKTYSQLRNGFTTDVEWCQQCGALQRWDGQRYIWMKPLRYKADGTKTGRNKQNSKSNTPRKI